MCGLLPASPGASEIIRRSVSANSADFEAQSGYSYLETDSTGRSDKNVPHGLPAHQQRDSTVTEHRVSLKRMARLTTLFVAMLVFLASAQCFAKCLEAPCRDAHSCHSQVKTCSHHDLLADDSAASTGYSLYTDAAPVPFVQIAAPASLAESFEPRPPVSPPFVASLSVTVLKI
jgi:hypothetical protein